MKKDDRRLEALRSAQEVGIIYFTTRIGTQFHVQTHVDSGIVSFTGPQVDAFLFGVRVGQINADKKFARME